MKPTFKFNLQNKAKVRESKPKFNKNLFTLYFCCKVVIFLINV